jgi:TRAP-type mannitol/chloroaromatic compound transport system permease small subunit
LNTSLTGRTAHTIDSAIDAFTEYCGKTIAWLTAAMVVITCTIVVMRYLLETGSIALQESLTYLHAMVFMGGISFALKQGGHVRVDIFYRNFLPRTKAYIDLAGALLLLIPVCLVIFWLNIDYVINSWAIQETSSESSGLPWVYLLKTLLLIMPSLLLLQGFAELIKSLRVLINADRTIPAQKCSDKTSH